MTELRSQWGPAAGQAGGTAQGAGGTRAFMDNYELSWHKFPCYQIMILWDLLCNPASCRLLRALQNNFLSTDMEMALSQGGTIFSPTKGKKKASFASVCIFMSTFLTYKCL